MLSRRRIYKKFGRDFHTKIHDKTIDEVRKYLDILERRLKNDNNDIDQYKFKVSHRYRGDTVYISGSRLETDKEFKKRLETHKIKLLTSKKYSSTQSSKYKKPIRSTYSTIKNDSVAQRPRAPVLHAGIRWFESNRGYYEKIIYLILGNK